MKIKKVITIFMSVCLLSLLLSGCGDAEEGTAGTDKQPVEENEKEAVAMGRYVEQTVDLPELAELETVLGLVQRDLSIVLYSYVSDTETSGTYYAYHKQEDASWLKEESVWLNKAFDKKKEVIRNIQIGAKGALYVWYFDSAYHPHILKTMDEDTVEEIKLPFNDQDKNLPNGYAITENGNVAISYMNAEMSGNIVLYDAGTGNELRRFKTKDISTDNICSQMDAAGTKLIIPSENGKGFTVYDTETGAVLDEIIVEQNSNISEVSGMIKIGQNNDYYYLSSQGLQHFQSGGSIMETIIDGSLNTIGMEGVQYSTLLFGDTEDFNILFNENGSYEFAHYTYDSTVSTLPEIKMSIYGLVKNKSVSRAIATYQKANPDVQITYYTAQSAEGASTVSDSIRTLNTELLSKKGADILILDGLPVESYVEKGILEDISDIITPMLTSGELLENFTGGNKKESSSIYAIPIRFSMPVFIGDNEINQAFQSLDTLQEYAKNNTGKAFLKYAHSTVTYEELAAFIFLIHYKEIIGDGSRLDKATLIHYLETVKETGKAIGATTKELPIPPTTEEDLKMIAQYKLQNQEDASSFEYGIFPVEDGTIQGYEIKGMADMMVPVTLKSQYGKVISSVNNLYIPTGTIGVNSSSEQLDKAKDFVRCILSEEEQRKDLDSGMPVNAKALESYCSKKSEFSEGTSYQLNGKEIQLTFDPPTKEEAADMISLAKTLTEPLNIDYVFKEMILSESKAFFEGGSSAEKAADAILTKANTYLAE